MYKRIPMAELAELLLLQMENGGRARLTVTGGSMLPMLHPHRDAVELVIPRNAPEKGDIILYRRENGAYVLHRIIRVCEDGYLCSGDNQVMREPVKPEQVLAVADGYIRKGKSCTMDKPGYRLYKGFWQLTFPLRGIYLAVRRPLGRLYRKWKRT
jgi:hypothetical protein